MPGGGQGEEKRRENEAKKTWTQRIEKDAPAIPMKEHYAEIAFPCRKDLTHQGPICNACGRFANSMIRDQVWNIGAACDSCALGDWPPAAPWDEKDA